MFQCVASVNFVVTWFDLEMWWFEREAKGNVAVLESATCVHVMF